MNESLNYETLGAEPCFYYPIPGGLLDRDVIEIKGHFIGQSIVIAILVENKDDHALPLQLELTSQGVWSVNAYGASGHHDQHAGRTNPKTDFQIRIIAYQDKYKIYANSLLLCSQVHKIPLPEVTHLSIDGEAEFTGVEFKDLQSESEDYDMNSSSQMEPAKVKSGLIRLSETRQSSNRKPQAPQDIQNRRSFQTKSNLVTQQLDNNHQLPTTVENHPPFIVPSKSETSLHQKDTKSKKEKTSGNKQTHSRDSQSPEDSKTDTKKKHSFSLEKRSSKNKKPKEEKVKEEKSWRKKMGKLKHSKPKVNEQGFEQEAKVNISKPSAKISMTIDTRI